MFTIIRRSHWKDLLAIQGPSLIGALVIAELFYKFHSFLLETAAFLATWFVLDAAISGLVALLRRQRSAPAR